MIGRFFAFLWSLARLFPAAGVQGVRFASGASVLLSFLFFLFFAAGLALVLFGFDLGAVGLWLERQSGWLEIAGTILFKIVLAGVLALCVLVVLSPLFGLRGKAKERRRDNEKTDGLGTGCAVLLALAIGYFCAVGLFLE